MPAEFDEDTGRHDASSETVEQREGRRAGTEHPVVRVFAKGKYSRAQLLDLADDGMTLSTQLLFSLGDGLSIDLSETCTVTGRVVWHHDGRCGVKLSEPIDSGAVRAV
jgi:hypothetical protein